MLAYALAIVGLPLSFYFGWFWFDASKLEAKWHDSLRIAPLGIALFTLGTVIRDEVADNSIRPLWLLYGLLIIVWIAAGATGLVIRMRHKRSDSAEVEC